MSAFQMDSDWLVYCQNPSTPSFQLPRGAVDAHCHVFGPGDRFPYARERKYTPCDAPAAKLFALRDFLGFERNVIVQATCHGADNRAVVDALQEAGFTDVSVEGSGPTRLAEATWPLEDASAPLPAQVVSVSEVDEA